MPGVPIESGVAGMTRRNYLVERNRLRVSTYEPTRKTLEEEDRQLAEAAAQEKRERQEALNRTRLMREEQGDRPLPGGGPRSVRMRDTEGQRNTNTFKEDQLAASRKKAEYNRLYNADMKAQLKERHETLKKMHDDEDRQMAALRELNDEQDRIVAEHDARARAENKAYMERMRQSNLRELENKRAQQRAEEESDLRLLRLVAENNRHRADMDVRQAENATRLLKLQNDEAHREAMKRREANKKKDDGELAALIEHDRYCTQKEREAEEAKRERFRQEFADCVARDKEFHRIHNYDEPVDSIRRRNELAAQSYKVMRREEQLRLAERKAEYESDLMKQIQEKQQWNLTHLDGL